jgi:hypothetical protein
MTFITIGLLGRTRNFRRHACACDLFVNRAAPVDEMAIAEVRKFGKKIM